MMTKARQRRHLRIRAKISGNALCPRVCVFRSSNHIYLQAIDDTKGVTIASCSDLKDSTANVAKTFTQKLLAIKIKRIVFDRGGYKYHGRIKKIADELRTAGLEF